MRTAGGVIVMTVLSLFFVGVSCAPSEKTDVNSQDKTMTTQKVLFETEDGVTVVGDLYRGKSDGPSALLLHMMPATKESWRDFSTALVGRGFSTVLAIDLRGHGESVMKKGVRLDYRDFEDSEHQTKMKDVEAAVRWLETQGVPKKRLALVGASIGANLAIAYAAKNPDVPAVVALSPGLNYRGITTEDKMSLVGDRPLNLIASAEDNVSFETDRRLATLKPDTTVKELDGAGHGTTMFEKAPGLMGEVVEWLITNIP